MRTLLRLTCLVLSATYFVDGVIASAHKKTTAERRSELKNRRNQVWTDSRVGIPGYNPTTNLQFSQTFKQNEEKTSSRKQLENLKKLFDNNDPEATKVVQELVKQHVSELKGKDFDIKFLIEDGNVIGAYCKDKDSKEFTVKQTADEIKILIKGILEGDL